MDEKGKDKERGHEQKSASFYESLRILKTLQAPNKQKTLLAARERNPSLSRHSE